MNKFEWRITNGEFLREDTHKFELPTTNGQRLKENP